MGEAEEGVCDCESGGCDGEVYEWCTVLWEVSENEGYSPSSRSGLRLRTAALSGRAGSAEC